MARTLNTIVFYNIPIQKNSRFVYLYKTKTEQEQALHSYVLGQTESVEELNAMPFFENQNILNVCDYWGQNLGATNYIKVVYNTLNPNQKEEKYFFVDGVATIQNEEDDADPIYQFTLSEDIYHNKVFTFDITGALVMPSTTFTAIEQSNDACLLSSASQKNTADTGFTAQALTSDTEPTINPLVGDFRRNEETGVFVGVYQGSDGVIYSLASECSTDFEQHHDFFYQYFGMCNATQIKEENTQNAISVKILKIYFIPFNLMRYGGLLSPFGGARFDIINNFYHEGSTGHLWGYPIEYFSQEFPRVFSVNLFNEIGVRGISSEVTAGTYNTKFNLRPKLSRNETLPVERQHVLHTANQDVEIKLYSEFAGGDIVIYTYDGDGNLINLSSEYEMPVAYSEASQYFTQKGISTAISTIGATATLASGVATGNAFAIAQGALNVAGNIAQIAEAKKQGGATVNIIGNGFANYIKCRGFALFVMPRHSNIQKITRYGINVNYTGEDFFTEIVTPLLNDNALSINNYYYRGTIENLHGATIDNDASASVVDDIAQGVTFCKL